MRQTEEYSALFVYPANLLIDIRGITTLELPQKLTKDVLAGIHYALSTLEEREQSVLQGVYEESLSLVDILCALSVGVSSHLPDLFQETYKVIYRKGRARTPFSQFSPEFIPEIANSPDKRLRNCPRNATILAGGDLYV